MSLLALSDQTPEDRNAGEGAGESGWRTDPQPGYHHSIAARKASAFRPGCCMGKLTNAPQSLTEMLCGAFFALI